MIDTIVTMPPYAPFLGEVARHPLVSGLRLNTVMPVKESLEEVLKRLQDSAAGKTIWIDLKGRQLRVVGYATPPFTEITVSHAIKVKTPVTAYFGNGGEEAKLVAVDGNRLIFLDGPKRVVGPGESMNIVDPSLEIDGYLTETDARYVEAAGKVGLHDYMLSYVESSADVAALQTFDAHATIAEKIESLKGIRYVREDYQKAKQSRLMLARGDLYTEVVKPHHILEATELLIAKDAEAIAASRICSSLAESLEPASQDISDIAYLLKVGYKTLMLGDEVCLRRESVLSALNLIQAIAEDYHGKGK